MMRSRPRYLRGYSGMSGFSMIEVLVALLILALGLLGFALLQTMTLRYTQSAPLRTQATNLAYDVLDQMRANRQQAAWYALPGAANFQPGDVDLGTAACLNRPLVDVTISQSVQRWKCETVRTLGSSARAVVTYNDGEVSVTIAWGDQRWDEDAPEATTEFAMSTRL